MILKTLLFCLLMLSLEAALAPTSLVAATRPNIVLVFIDDMGWGDFSCFGNQDAQTPRIDRMAREGTRFERFYVCGSVCHPSRTTFMTGQYLAHCFGDGFKVAG